MILIKFTLAALTLLGIGFGYSFYKYGEPGPLLVPRDLVIHYQKWTELPEGSKLTSTSVRIERPNGDWKETESLYDKLGKLEGTKTKYAIQGKGVFQVSYSKKELFALNGEAGQINAAEDDMRHSPNFENEDERILGYKVFKLKLNDTDSIYLAPALHWAMLKQQGRGSFKIATSAEYVWDSGFGDLPDYPINQDSVKKNAERRAAAEANPPKQ
jgi:hypothetical protein